MSEIKQVIIHPAIGVARVGNSPKEYFSFTGNHQRADQRFWEFPG